MAKLNIEKLSSSSRMDTVKITGFKDGELVRLKTIPHSEAEERLLTMLDERNGNLGTCYKCGYGVYGMWFDNEAAYLNVGNSCD